jgi:hypothetical protein
VIIKLNTLLAAVAFLAIAGCDASTGTAFFEQAPGGGGGGGSVGGPEATLLHEMPVFGGGVITLEMNGGGTIAVYTATDDPLGDHPNGDVQLFSIAVGTIAPFQISENTADVFSFTGSFDVDDAGAEVVFVSTQDLVGTNPGNAYNIF